MALQQAETGSSVQAPAGASETEAQPGMRPWWMLIVVTIIYLSAGVDRGGLPVLVNPIKADLGLSDVQISLLMGFAFTLMQCAAFLPMGYLVDRFNRRLVLGCSVVAWSSVSALTGFAGSFTQLFLCRSGLAVAEANVQPAAHSMIRDAFPPEKRGIAYSVYLSGISISASLSLLVAGTLITAGDSGFFSTWPILGHMKTWQIVLAFPGVCSLPLAFLLMTVHEPVRRGATAIKSSLATTGEAVRYVWQHRWVYGPFFAAAILSNHPLNAVNAWMPTALARGWDIKPSDVARITGGIGLFASLGGVFCGGVALHFLSKRKVWSGGVRLCAINTGLGMSCWLGALHVHQHWLIYTLLGCGQFVFAANYAALSSSLAYITPSRLMGRMTALYFMSFGVLGGQAWAPTAVALIAKYGYDSDHHPKGLISAMNVFIPPTVILCLVLLLFAAVRIDRFSRTYPDGVG